MSLLWLPKFTAAAGGGGDPWVNRTVVQAPRNGTTSHTISFAAATSGNFLVGIMGGAVTHTTPSGWTLQATAVNNSELEVWTKTASASESSLSSTHNGSNYPVLCAVYEFPSGTTWVGDVAANNQSATAANPNLTGLTPGTGLTVFGAYCTSQNGSTTISGAWGGSTVEDIDVSVAASGTDGYGFGLGYIADYGSSSYAPALTITNMPVNNSERLTFAVQLP